jgi:biotin/methionine sulfoxide reductase
MTELTDGVRRVPHCSHWGAYTLLVRDGEIIGAEPFAQDPSPSPIIHSVRDWADPSRRVLRPLVRRGWLERRDASDRAGRGREPYVEVSWDEALDLVAGEIDRVRHAFGNASIFAGSYGWTSCGRFHHASSQLKRMLNLVGGYTGHVDTYSIAAGPAILRHVLGSDTACGGGATTLGNIAEHSETLLVFGALTPRTAQNEAGGIGRHMLETHLRRMKERGVRIVLVSPRADDIPEWAGAEWWPIRPNTDTALMLALAREVVAAGRADRDFLARCCSGVEPFLAYLAGADDGVAKDAEWAAPLTELPAARIRALATRLATTRSMITVSWSLQRADHGEQPFWAALGLASVLGQIGLPGGGVGYGYGSLGGVGDPLSLAPSPALPHGRKPNPHFIPVARIADLLLNPGAEFDYQGRSFTYPDTRLVYWAGGNPFHHHQDINRLRRAWERPETIIVQDPVWTATAARADIVLPASTSIERNDIAAARRSDYILAMHKAIEPLGASRPDFDICRDIADRLGTGAAFTEGRDEMGWLRHLYEACREDVMARLGSEMPDFDRFWAEGFARMPTGGDHVFLREFREDPARAALQTESGRIVLTSRALAELDLPDCRAHPAWLAPAEWLGDDAAEAELPFHLISAQPDGRLHSQLVDGPASAPMRRDGRERVLINPADAARLGIAEDTTVRLWSRRGQTLAVAALSEAVRPGVLVLPTSSWYEPLDEGADALDLSGNPNVLTLDKGTSRFGQGCAAHTCLVGIEPVRAGNLPRPSLTGAPPARSLSAA